jgi:uncharacterized protein YjbI with pentapeptide repeats
MKARPRAACLAAALAAISVLVAPDAAPAQQTFAFCEFNATPPSPPDRGAVLWSPLQRGSTEPNTIVFPRESHWSADLPGCAPATANRPHVISVAPRGALQFIGLDNKNQPSLVMNWGAVNVGLSDSPPVFPWQTTQFVSAGDLTVDISIAGFQWSCRGCDFSGMNVTLSPQHPPAFNVVAFANDFSVAKFRGATLGGSASSFDFSGADFRGVTFNNVELTGATFNGAIFLMSDFLKFRQTYELSGAQVVASAADRRALAGDLSGVNLTGVAFVGEPLDLTGTKFDGATLTGTSFALARLAGASFVNVSAERASFQDADLSSDDTHPAANFSGPQTNLQHANFLNANVSGASFANANLSGAVFTQARAVRTDFTGATLAGARFERAHVYGNGQAFVKADLSGIDFTGAVLAGDVTVKGAFDLSGATLTGAQFDGAVCVNCDLSNATLDQATLTGAYLPGVILSQATLTNASFDSAWLYCGGPNNPKCPSVPGSQPQLWTWPLALGSGEAFGPVQFAATNLQGVNFDDVTACPNGKSGTTLPKGCAKAELLPDPDVSPPPPPIPAPCSPSARGTCPTPTSTLWPPPPPFDAGPARPLAIVPTAPPTWNTTLNAQGYYVAFDDGTIRLISSDGTSTIFAGTPNKKCAGATSPCGDGGPATAALLGQPTGLAVDLDGSLYIADPAPVLRVRVINPSGTIATIAGNGLQCPAVPCGDGGRATEVALYAASGVSVDIQGVLLIADGIAGVRRVAPNGIIGTLAPGTGTGNVVSVVSTADGLVYAATRSPDFIIQIDPSSGAVKPVVGTGSWGYNGTTDPFHSGSPLPGTQVQVNQPFGLAIDLDGNVLFADSANHLIRAYVPSTTNVIDDLAGQIPLNGIPQGGFNGDGHWATDTELNRPMGVAATRSALVVIADTDNNRVRQVGPAPVTTGAGPEVVVSCRSGQTWSCRRLSAPPGSVATENTAAITISHEGTVVATGRSLLPSSGRLRLHVTEHRPLVPGRYDLVIVQAGRPQHQTIWIDQGPDLTGQRRR